MNLKSIAKAVAPPIAWSAMARIRAGLRKSPVRQGEGHIKHRIGNLDLLLNPDHGLPLYQRAYPRYDRFLPTLSAMLPSGWVIDVGANVGDTLYAMIQDSTCRFLCVEPDPLFFDLLERNVSTLPSELKQRVELENVFVSSSSQAKATVRTLGTARAVSATDTATAASATLSGLFAKHGIALTNIVLVKVDTDGYDADCLMSLGPELSTAAPLLFWEHEFGSAELEDTNFQRLFDYLGGSGYELVCLFDNAGNVICTGDLTTLRQHHSYLRNIYEGRTTLSIGGARPWEGYYMDVLASKRSTRSLFDAAIARYAE